MLNYRITAESVDETLDVALLDASRFVALVKGLFFDLIIGPIVELVHSGPENKLLDYDVLLVEKHGSQLLKHRVV